MTALLEGSWTIRTNVSADIFYDKTYVAHRNKEFSDDDGENDGSSTVTSTPPHARKSRVATTTPKMSILLNQSEDIEAGYFRNFGFVDIQRSHRDTFGNDPMIFPDNPTNQNKTMTEKELYAFSELCMLDLFIHIIRKNYVGTDNVDYSRSTQKVCQAIKNLRQEWIGVNGKTVTLTPYIVFDKYMALSICLPDNVSLWTITLCAAYFTSLTSEVVDRMVSEKCIMPQLQILTSKETQLNALKFVK